MSATSRLDELWSDTRFAVRTLRKSPAFVTVAVLCLALGIGANGAIFSVVHAVLLRPLPYAEPERVVRLYETMPARGANWSGSVSWANYLDWQAEAKSYTHLAALSGGSKNLSGTTSPERVQAVMATGNLFELLGTRALVGRTFGVEDATEDGAGGVVVLAEGLWRRRFGADPSVVGRTVTLDGVPTTVIGVVPQASVYPPGAPTEVFVPWKAPADAAQRRGSHWLQVIGRLRPGVALTSADAELREVARRIEVANPVTQAGRSAVVQSLTETLVGRTRPALLMLLGAVGLVLLIACANVANLLLARAAGRQQEVAVRVALGASRGRIVRQLLVESLLLSLAGAALGVLLARWGLDALAALASKALPLADRIALDGPVLGFLLGLSALSAVVFGLAPALQASRTDLYANLTGAGRVTSVGARRFRMGLVVAEISLSLVLLVGAGLLLRGFARLLDVPPGLDPTHVLTAHLPIPSGKYAPAEVSPRLLTPALERVRALPGVQGAALISMLPIQSAWTNSGYQVDGEVPAEAGKEPIAEIRLTSDGFFRTLGIPLRQGRDFEPRDLVKGDTVPIIVNEALAKRHWKDGEALGRRLLLNGQTAVIVGVVGDVRQAGLDLQPLGEVHLPLGHPDLTGWGSDRTLVVKSPQPPEALTAAVREAVRAVDADQPLYNVLTMEEVVQRSVANRRFLLLLLGTFAAIALVLAAFGLYGVISHAVAQRSRELGIRMALGAQGRDVVRLVLGQGAALTAAGLVLGLAGALALSEVMDQLVYGVGARDPATFLTVAAGLGAVALFATWVPARRATRVDPVTVLKAD